MRMRTLNQMSGFSTNVRDRCVMWGKGAFTSRVKVART